ncbi:MAG: TolC family protein [Acidobacteria bacterium]|nr:TolC family protein [Acidobacteriota bacterium]
MSAASFLAVFLAAASTRLLTAEPLTLQEAIETARANNPQLLESAASAAAAQEAHREARLSRLPTFELREVALRTDSPADTFGLKLMQEKFSFPDFVASDPNAPEPVTNFATEIQASVPLYTGGRITAGIGQAAQMANASVAMRARTGEAVEFMVASAYMNLLLADRFVELAQKARDTTGRHVEQAQAYFDAGMIVESDLLQARVQMARMEEALISARNNARLARAGLNRAMGVDQSRAYDLDPSLPEAALDWKNLDDAISAASDRRQDLRAVAAKVNAASLAITRARGEYLPEVALVGKIAINDDRVFGGNGRSYTVMALARWNFWNWGQTQARVARSRSEHVAALEAQRGYRQQVEFEVREAWQAVEDARARSQVASAAVASAEKALAILDARFEQGVTKVTDLLDAETMLNEARARALQAGFDSERSMRALGFATGQPNAASHGSEER